MDSGTCPRCRDTGYRGWKTEQNYPLEQVDFCGCALGVQRKAAAQVAVQQRRRSAQHFARSGVPALMQHYTLEAWGEMAQGDVLKQRALQHARAWSPKKEGKRGIYLFGPASSGKTGLLTALVLRAMAEGSDCLWIEWFDFVDSIQGQYGKEGGRAQEMVEAAQKAGVLLLDDAGDPRRGEESQDKQRLMYQIVNHRYNAELPLLMTSNLDPKGFVVQFGQRTWERVEYMCECEHVGGRNLRKLVRP